MHAISSASPPVNLLGVRVSTAGIERTAEAIIRWASSDVSSDGPRYVCATSVHGLIVASEDPAFRAVLNRAAIVTADGMPLVWVGRLRGAEYMTRVYGPDLTKLVCQMSSGLPIRHFFYGGGAGVAEELAGRLQAWYPGLQVAGTYCPPFRSLADHELDGIAEEIDRARADVVWVGLSTPKQERWIGAMQPRLRSVKVMLSVGAAFDFHTGRVAQAPTWMQENGLEWVFRISREPRRLLRRYAYNNPRFVWRAGLQVIGLRRFELPEA